MDQDQKVTRSEFTPNKQELSKRIEKIRRNKAMFKTPSSVQGLGTTWTNWVSQTWQNSISS